MKIAVIGATGMIGHHAAKAVVDEGHELTIIHRKSSNLDHVSDLTFRSAIADLNDLPSLSKALSDVDAVINCAGYYPTLPRPWQDEVETATALMANFYAACKQVKLHKIVYLGAAIALQKHPKGEPADAEMEYPSCPKNKNPYLQVKWALDTLAKEMARQDLPVVIGIPSMTFGEYDFGPTTGQLLTGIANETLPGFVKGNRNVIYAGDAGRALVLACEKGQVGERYLFTGSNISMHELAAKISTASEVPLPKTIPLLVATFVSKLQAVKYRLFGGDAPKISSTAIAVMSAGQFLNGDKAEKELGFKAEVSLDEGLERTLSWFKKMNYID